MKLATLALNKQISLKDVYRGIMQPKLTFVHLLFSS